MAVEKLKAAGHLPELEEIADPAADFAIDAFAHGPLSIMLEEFRSRLLEEAANIAGIAGKRCIEANDLEQAYERLLRPSGSGDWPVQNRRRVYLIQKLLAGDIRPEEVMELGALQEKADCRMSEVAPRPLEMLWDLKRKLTSQ
jgi:histone H3/H4